MSVFVLVQKCIEVGVIRLRLSKIEPIHSIRARVRHECNYVVFRVGFFAEVSRGKVRTEVLREPLLMGQRYYIFLFHLNILVLRHFLIDKIASVRLHSFVVNEFLVLVREI